MGSIASVIMKKYIICLILVLAMSTFAQPPVQRNRYTTNLDSALINGANITNLQFNASGLSVSNVSIQILNLLPTNVTAGVGTLSGSIGSHFWTNTGGGFGRIAIGDNFIVAGVQQFLVTATNMGATNVLFTYTTPTANYTNVAWLYSPNSMNIFDTVPRIVGSIGNDGAIMVMGHDDGFGNSGRIYVGGTTNVFSITEGNDTSGSAFLVGSAFGGVKLRIYDSAVVDPFDILSNGVTFAKFGLGSTSSQTPIAITATGITNSWTNNGTAFLTDSGTTYIVNNNAGTPMFTNTTPTVVGLPVPLQPGGSITAASGLSGRLVPW